MEVDNSSELEVIQPVNSTGPIRKPLTFWKGVLYGLVILGAQLIVGGMTVAAGFLAFGLEAGALSPDSETMSKMMNLVMAVALPGSFLLAVAILLSRRKLHPNAWRWQNHYLLLLPLGLLMLFGFDYILGEAMTYLPNYEQMLEDYKTMFEGIDMKYLLIGGVIVGPICEEIIFRGIIEEGFIQTYDGPRAILYSAIIFGTIHLVPLQVLSAGLAGILLGWIYWKTRSLWIVMILHIVNNYIAFTFSDLDTRSSRELLNSDMLYYASFPLALLLMYGAYWLFCSVAEKNKFDNKEVEV